MELELSDFRTKPYVHQLKGVRKLIEKQYFALFDEMGVGKTKQVIDAAQILFKLGMIDRVVVVCPASVRAVWYDEDMGELQKHLFTDSLIVEYHQRCLHWYFGNGEPQLQWIITNYDFIRRANRLKPILDICNQKTLLVLDESSAIKSYRAEQTKACMALRQKCGRVILLNGTPIANNPGDLYSQSKIMHPTILNCDSFYHFRARYAVMGGWRQKKIIDWIRIDDLRERLRPYVLRRLKKQCLDLPVKLPSITYTVALRNETWEIYKEMRDEMVAWLTSQAVSIAPQAVIKALRLAQITTGFIGGIRHDEWDTSDYKTEEIGREKLDFLLTWLDELLSNDPTVKLLIWCRFRAELQRLFNELCTLYPFGKIAKITGGQKKDDRDYALRLLDPRTTPKEFAIIIGSPQAGGIGLNLAAAHTVVYMSNDYSLKNRLQSEDRVHRPGQTFPVSYFDIVATGPNGQKTIDHIIIKAIREKYSVADFTCRRWIDEFQRLEKAEGEIFKI